MYEFSFIYKHKYEYLKPIAILESKGRNKSKKMSFPLLQCRVDGMKIPIFLWYFISTFLNLKHIQNITTVKQGFQFFLHDS